MVKNKKFYFILFFLFLLFLIFIWYRFQKLPKLCGNGICNFIENCANCQEDCKCQDGQYCSFKLKKCIQTKCGNRICEPFEGPENCCLDCKCFSGFICNEETKKCEEIKLKISDEKVKEVTIKYFQEKGEKVNEIEILRVGNFWGKRAKLVRVSTSKSGIQYLAITENEEVIILPAF